jgi:dTDP-4-amino-4,6-dideoxygalactose transaminase
MIPMVDLTAQDRALRDDIEHRVREVLAAGRFVLGPNVQAFEAEVAAYLGVEHAVGVASGTDALHLALVAAGIGPGDEVITTPFTFVATAEAIRYVGARPVFVDIDPRTFNLDPERVSAAIGERTRAVLPVHLFGQPASLVALGALCDAHGLTLIEDCAQSMGAGVDGRKTGTFGLAGAFSFFPSKNLGCCGDGGLVATRSAALAEHVRALRNHGSRAPYRHGEIGYNSRLDEIQAAVLRAKLPHLDAFNRQRRRVAERYGRGLAGAPVVTPFEDGAGTHVYHQYTILTERREAVAAALERAGSASAVYYPIPLHRQEAFAADCAGLSLPEAERVAARCLSLPMYPELPDAAVDRICEAVRSAA